MINIFEPTLGNEELEAIKSVFESKWLGKGKITAKFEEEYANHIGIPKELVLSTNNCTEGLFSSMEICGIKPGDEVIVPSISFVGAGNAVLAHGAKMVLCDVDRRTLNATALNIEKVITKKTKAVLLLHYGGVPCEMDEIMSLVKKYNLILIEDSAPGVCSTYNGKFIGTFGEMGMWSFDAMKILVTGDGAMLSFNSKDLRDKAEKLLYFGLESKSGFSNSVDKKWWEYDVSVYGHRSIMNDITAAMGREQLIKLPIFMEKRKFIHDYYNNKLKNISWLEIPLEIPHNCTTSYYFYHIQVKG
ncbi:MAG: DegT/DnrJ/EryC1/StrS family aminotransferase, partial [Candidatus Izemoplasmatales bacterium]|nr:DegT/DnrJ/EryC1/StrS family aminotransferase [Candidatus Izemoplasmatales bacterium]